jgi:hypothetical protein
MSRTLKLVIPERGGTLNLPVCSLIMSVGFQRERRPTKAPATPWETTAASLADEAPVATDKAPLDDFSDEEGDGYAEYNVTITDRRTGKPEVRRSRIDQKTDPSDEVQALNDAYHRRGFDVTTAMRTAQQPVAAPPVATPEPEPSLVPVLWFQVPNTEEVGFDADAWPKADVEVEVVPTGSSPRLANMVFVGTLQRPQRQRPDMDAVFHIFVQRSEFITIR